MPGDMVTITGVAKVTTSEESKKINGRSSRKYPYPPPPQRRTLLSYTPTPLEFPFQGLLVIPPYPLEFP